MSQVESVQVTVLPRYLEEVLDTVRRCHVDGKSGTGKVLCGQHVEAMQGTSDPPKNVSKNGNGPMVSECGNDT